MTLRAREDSSLLLRRPRASRRTPKSSRALSTATWTLALALLAACAAPSAPSGPTATSAAPSTSAPPWAPTPTPDDPAVATVNGVPILLSRLQAAVDADGGATAPRVLLDRLVEAEVLAAAARREGYDTHADVVEATTRGLVRGLIERKFLLRSAGSFFDERILEDLYRIPSVRVKFDHVDVFRVVDAQFTCCPRRFDECNAKEFAACMAEEAPNAAGFFEYVKDKATDAKAFATFIREWEVEHRRLGFKEYSFFYDVKVSHAEQRGFNIVNENVAKAVLGTKVGGVTPPVASRNAWHVLFLLEHQPEQHKGVDDPEVRDEIVTRLLPKKQASELQAWLQQLRKDFAVEVFPEALKALFAGAEVVD